MSYADRTTSCDLERPRAAFERIGARLDGALRQHPLPEGSWRDTRVHVIIAHEWPAVRGELRRRLAAGGATPQPT